MTTHYTREERELLKAAAKKLNANPPVSLSVNSDSIVDWLCDEADRLREEPRQGPPQTATHQCPECSLVHAPPLPVEPEGVWVRPGEQIVDSKYPDHIETVIGQTAGGQLATQSSRWGIDETKLARARTLSGQPVLGGWVGEFTEEETRNAMIDYLIAKDDRNVVPGDIIREIREARE